MKDSILEFIKIGIFVGALLYAFVYDDIGRAFFCLAVLYMYRDVD